MMSPDNYLEFILANKFLGTAAATAESHFCEQAKDLNKSKSKLVLILYSIIQKVSITKEFYGPYLTLIYISQPLALFFTVLSKHAPVHHSRVNPQF